MRTFDLAVWGRDASRVIRYSPTSSWKAVQLEAINILADTIIAATPTGSIKSRVDDACCRRPDRKNFVYEGEDTSGRANSLDFEPALKTRQMHSAKGKFIFRWYSAPTSQSSDQRIFCRSKKNKFFHCILKLLFNWLILM